MDLLAMTVEWRPDADNVNQSSGRDNLSLHRVPVSVPAEDHQRLDHIGFMVRAYRGGGSVARIFTGGAVPMKTAPRTRRDGARSFHCSDPDGNTVQIIYHLPLAAGS